MNPEAAEALRRSLATQGGDGADLVPELLETLRQTLASAIGDVFLVAMVALLVGFAATVFLKEMSVDEPQRGWETETKPSPEGS